MTDIQSQGAQIAIDVLADVIPIVLVCAVALVLTKMMIKFITGRF